MGGIEIILGLQSLRSPPLDSVVVSISALGSRYAYMIMLPVIYWLIDRRRGWVLTLVFLLLMQVNALIKEFTEVSRPFQVDQRVELIGPEPFTYAFPSGHAQGSTMIWGGLAAMNPSAVSAVVYVSVIFLVGLTRLYLGVHWPLDVSAGWVLGGLGLAAMSALFKLIQIYPDTLKNWRVRLLWLIAGVGMIILCPSKDTVLAGATLAAAATLEYCERKWIGFDDCGKVSQRIARVASGFIPAGVLLALYKYFAFESLWIRGIFFFLVGGWMVLGAPYLFKKLKI
jgi:membrane-associated phospholipid phosphatase